MKTKLINVRVSGSSYPIAVGIHLEHELIAAVHREGDRRIVVITDSSVATLFLPRILSSFRKSGLLVNSFVFPSGEKHKNQDTVTKLQHEMLQKKFGRDSLVVALGGGVTGDIAGFVAATYMRGIPYIQVPTTLLAMADSSIGGKVGVNTPFGKNTVGAFWQPRAVIADVAYVAHLPRREFVNGLFEAIKIFITSDARMLEKTQRLDLASPLKTAKLLQDIIYSSVAIKAGIVERDEREMGERLVVNFGHTIGHAIELLSDFKISHGFAVGYGMLVESKIAELLGLLSPSEFDTVRAHLRRLGIKESALSRFSISRILEIAKTDKKSKVGRPHYVLLSGIGAVHRNNGMYAHPVKDAIVKKAFTLCTREK